RGRPRRRRPPPPTSSAALAYAARGIPVLPIHSIRDGRCACPHPDCRSPGKHPIPELVPRGLHDASRDEATIRAWWSTCPDANIAGVLGAGVGLVLDCDPRNGGEESFAAVRTEHGGFPRGPIADTGGGGGFQVVLPPRRYRPPLPRLPPRPRPPGRQQLRPPPSLQPHLRPPLSVDRGPVRPPPLP
ncbi:bifunctional DNA primase/polymerase, partial [mine drainage metagenome]